MHSFTVENIMPVFSETGGPVEVTVPDGYHKRVGRCLQSLHKFICQVTKKGLRTWQVAIINSSQNIINENHKHFAPKSHHSEQAKTQNTPKCIFKKTNSNSLGEMGLSGLFLVYPVNKHIN